MRTGGDVWSYTAHEEVRSSLTSTVQSSELALYSGPVPEAVTAGANTAPHVTHIWTGVDTPE